MNDEKKNKEEEGWIRDPVNDEKFFVYADIDPNGNHVFKLGNRHSEGHVRSPYHCFRCKQNKAYSNKETRIIKCENCNAEWTFEEMLNECDFRIGLGKRDIGEEDDKEK